MSAPFSISVIVPVYNEAPFLKGVIRQIDDFLAAHVREYEILIVESGSSDGSDTVCDEVARQMSAVRVIHEAARNGFGSAMRLGYRAAAKDLVWLVTVDLPFPLEALLRALPLMATYDCVLSSRATDPRSLCRRTQSAVYNVLVRILLDIRVRHVNSAFKIFKRHVIQSLPLEANGWLLDAEVLYQIERHGFSYIELPVPLVDRTVGRSSVRASSALWVLKDLIRFTIRTRVRERVPPRRGTAGLRPRP